MLVATGELLKAALTAGQPIAPAGEWLLDNFYLIEEQIRTAQAAPAQGLQPRAAAPARRAVGRPAARLRHRARSDLARRRPGRRGKPAALRRRLPERRAADAGRAVGDPDHAAPGADREPAPRRRAHRRQHRRAQPAPTPGPTDDRDRRARSEEPDPGDRGHGALEPADGELLRRRARAPPAGPERRARAAAHLDRAAPRRSSA